MGQGRRFSLRVTVIGSPVAFCTHGLDSGYRVTGQISSRVREGVNGDSSLATTSMTDLGCDVMLGLSSVPEPATRETLRTWLPTRGELQAPAGPGPSADKRVFGRPGALC